MSHYCSPDLCAAVSADREDLEDPSRRTRDLYGIPLEPAASRGSCTPAHKANSLEICLARVCAGGEGEERQKERRGKKRYIVFFSGSIFFVSQSRREEPTCRSIIFKKIQDLHTAHTFYVDPRSTPRLVW